MSYASQSPGMANSNPEPILDMNYAFVQTAMLMAAVRLYIFTYPVNDPLSPATLAILIKVELDSITRLLECLRVLGLAERKGNVYRLTPAADRFLVQNPETFLGMDKRGSKNTIPENFLAECTSRGETQPRSGGTQVKRPTKSEATQE